mgnify:CR=1 FL=1
MSEFVKKTIVGYKDVPGGSSDPDCTHVILTLNEYKKIVRERDEAIRTVGIERQNADRQMNEEKNNVAYQIRQVRDQAVKEIAEILHVSESNVKVRLSHGRAALREEIKEDWNYDES